MIAANINYQASARVVDEGANSNELHKHFLEFISIKTQNILWQQSIVHQNVKYEAHKELMSHQ